MGARTMLGLLVLAGCYRSQAPADEEGRALPEAGTPDSGGPDVVEADAGPPGQADDACGRRWRLGPATTLFESATGISPARVHRVPGAFVVIGEGHPSGREAPGTRAHPFLHRIPDARPVGDPVQLDDFLDEGEAVERVVSLVREGTLYIGLQVRRWVDGETSGSLHVLRADGDPPFARTQLAWDDPAPHLRQFGPVPGGGFDATLQVTATTRPTLYRFDGTGTRVAGPSRLEAAFDARRGWPAYAWFWLPPETFLVKHGSPGESAWELYLGRYDVDTPGRIEGPPLSARERLAAQHFHDPVPVSSDGQRLLLATWEGPRESIRAPIESWEVHVYALDLAAATLERVYGAPDHAGRPRLGLLPDECGLALALVDGEWRDTNPLSTGGDVLFLDPTEPGYEAGARLDDVFPLTGRDGCVVGHDLAVGDDSLGLLWRERCDGERLHFRRVVRE